MTRPLATALCIVVGTVMFSLGLVSGEGASWWYQGLIHSWQIIFACGVLVGGGMFVRSNLRKIGRRQDAFYNSVAVAGAVAMPLFALFGGLAPHAPFQWIFLNVQVPMQSTIFGLLAFFVSSAAFRGFRARNARSVVLLATALIVIIGRVPLGEMLWDGWADVINWIRDFPATAGRRAILIGIGLGSVTTSLRVLFGVDRSYIGGGAPK